MKPRLVIEAVIADLMTSCTQAGQCVTVFFAGCVLTDDKKCYADASLRKKFENSRYNEIKVTGIRLP
jgi:hypothetical protein